MTGATGRHLHAPLRPALPARPPLRRLDRRPPAPPRPARHRTRRPAGGRHLASRYRLHPGPHLRRHPPHRTRHQERGRRGPVLPGLHTARATATGPPCPANSPPAPTSTSPEGGNPHVHHHRSAAAHQRNNPYVLDELAVSFHHSAAGIAWRWRTELAILAATRRRAVAARRADHPHLGRGRPGRARPRRSWPCRPPAGSSPAGSGASWPATASSGSATKPACTPAPGGSRWSCGPGPTKVGERAHVLCRAGICAEDFEAHIGELRAACYARDARVTRNPRWSHLVTIDIIRRDTLAASQSVPSPAASGCTAHWPSGPAAEAPATWPDTRPRDAH